MASTNTVNNTVVLDQAKYLSKRLLARSHLRCVMSSLCDQDQMQEGSGLTAYMVRYKRMNAPVTTLTEGTPPAVASTFTLEQVTVTLDQWGDFVQISDVAQLTANHPLMKAATDLLADNAARVMDREITQVILAGTNIQYGDGSVITRDTIQSTMKISDQSLQKARVTLVNAGAPPRGGPAGDARPVAAQGNFANGSTYVAVCGPEVLSDIMQPSTSFGSFVSAAVYANTKALYNAEIGQWLGYRFVETNFLPKFVQLGNATVSIGSGAGTWANAGGITGLTITTTLAGGLLGNATFGLKITRKDLLRGFEEAISQVKTITTGGATAKLTFTMPSTAGYVYNVYLDTVAGGGSTSDALLSAIYTNLAAASVSNYTSAVPANVANPPASLRSSGDGFDPAAIYPVFIFGEAAVGWVGFYKAKFLMSGSGAEKADPLAQFRTAGYKFFGKAVIKDGTRLLRIEAASTY